MISMGATIASEAGDVDVEVRRTGGLDGGGEGEVWALGTIDQQHEFVLLVEEWRWRLVIARQTGVALHEDHDPACLERRRSDADKGRLPDPDSIAMMLLVAEAAARWRVWGPDAGPGKRRAH